MGAALAEANHARESAIAAKEKLAGSIQGKWVIREPRAELERIQSAVALSQAAGWLGSSRVGGVPVGKR